MLVVELSASNVIIYCEHEACTNLRLWHSANGRATPPSQCRSSFWLLTMPADSRHRPKVWHVKSSEGVGGIHDRVFRVPPTAEHVLYTFTVEISRPPRSGVPRQQPYFKY